ncbi:hypothetical protein ABIA06_000128 [Bradyrhizobium yuanmingense]|uniref:hypothetical protein n=1 Tax=Bradyrhizobium yuanmingense TaxID=108015 RepID=UPI003513D9BE
MIRIGQRELEVPMWIWAAVPLIFVALVFRESTLYRGIVSDPDVDYVRILAPCAVASIAGFLLVDLMRRASTPWYGLPFLLMASFAAPAIAIGWLNGAMRELIAVVVGAAITAAAGRGGSGAAGFLLLGITLGTPLVAGALLTLLFTLVSRFLADLPLRSRDAWRELVANLGAMVLWLVVALGGYIAIRTSFGLGTARMSAARAVPHWLPVVAALLGAFLATAAHLALAARARRNQANERHGLKIWLLAAVCGAAFVHSPDLFGLTGHRLMYDHIRPMLRSAHMLSSPDMVIAKYRVSIPFHDHKTHKGLPMPDGQPSYITVILPDEFGLSSKGFLPSVHVYRRDITLQQTSTWWTDRRKLLEDAKAAEPDQDAVVRFAGSRGSIGLRSDQYPEVDVQLSDFDPAVSTGTAEQALRRFLRERLQRLNG